MERSPSSSVDGEITQIMNRERLAIGLLLVLLVVATLLTALLVAAGRYWLTWSPAGAGATSQTATGMIMASAFLFVGGLPGALLTWAHARSTGWADLRGAVASAALGSGVCAIFGLPVLRLGLWDTADWLLTTACLAVIGFVGFVAAMLIARRAMR